VGGLPQLSYAVSAWLIRPLTSTSGKQWAPSAQPLTDRTGLVGGTGKLMQHLALMPAAHSVSKGIRLFGRVLGPNASHSGKLNPWSLRPPIPKLRDWEGLAASQNSRSQLVWGEKSFVGERACLLPERPCYRH
jgi:hypothetical protein